MPIKLFKINDRFNQYSVRKFIVDTVEDIQKLPRQDIFGTIETDPNDKETNNPCACGSLAFVTSTFDLYILNASNEWVTK